MKNNSLIAFIAGAIAGGVATWLLLSDEGKELLNKIKSEIGATDETDDADSNESTYYE